MKLTKTLAISAMATAVALLTIIVPMGASAAGDNNIPYNFNVPGNQNWGYDNNSQYRGTSNTKVPWMVNFTFSGEGITARSEYFILGDGWNYNKYSDYKGVNQGSGAKYQGNRMKKSLIFVQNYLFFVYDLTKNIIIGS